MLLTIILVCGFSSIALVIFLVLSDEKKASEWMNHYQYTADKQLMGWNLNLKRTGKRWYIHARINSDRRTEEMSAVRMRKILREMEEARPTEVFEKYQIPQVVKKEARPLDDAPQIGQKPNQYKPPVRDR